MDLSTLSDDLLAQVLSWLPVDTLLQCRFVCKSWYSLLTENPNFINMHLSHSTRIRDPSVLLSNRKGRQVIYSFDYGSDGTAPTPKLITRPFNSDFNFKIMGTCNGVFCIRVVSIRKGEDDMLCLWNPSTKESKRLPPALVELPEHFPNGVKICQRINKTVYGFGYDGVSNDYKVVRCVYFPSVNDSEVRVYNLRTNSWRIVGKNPFRPHADRIVQKFGLLLNGVVHWLIKNKSDVTQVVRFHLGCEVFRGLPLPEFARDDSLGRLNLQVLRGYLALFHNNVPRQSVDVWVLKEYGKDSWSKLFTIGRSVVESTSAFACFKPLRFYGNGKILMMYDQEYYILYDPNEDTHTRVKKYLFVRYGFDSATYVESLVSLKSTMDQEQGQGNKGQGKKRKNKRKRKRSEEKI